VIWESIVETLTTTGTLFFIAVGANLLTRFLALSGSGDLIASSVIGIQADPLMLLIGISAIYLLLGMFLDPLGAMLLTLPVLLPVLDQSNIELIWFGVFLVKFLEIGMITPPIGLNLFIISAISNVGVIQIFRAAIPYFVILVVVLGLITYVPELSTTIPRLAYPQ
jgi:TRAP-type C4-dicarboxylate transport system permease large subunit